MVTVTIDNRPIEVPAGTKVIEAAARLGIIIPRICYLKALGAVGACRVCAVKFLAGPIKGIQMSCMMDAVDGMVVSTTDPEAVDFRRYVIEWLMINHPHDCPVCDEGGHCLLQDLTVAGGHGRRRFTGNKRTYLNQDLGPLVEHEMNRCIHCYRCVRFYREYAGGDDLGAMGIASKVYFGRFESGRLESPFAGNLIDVCPTGVYTDKPSRFRSRRWDLDREPSVCLHCSLGCNVMPGARYREVLRVEARENEEVNGPFICDRGRYGYFYTSLEGRPRETKVDGKPASWDEACGQAADRLRIIADKYGGESIAVLGSARSTLETQLEILRISTENHWRAPHFFTDPRTGKRAGQAVGGLDRQLAAGLPDIQEADCLIAIGIDPLAEAPMLALAMRQAWRGGALVGVLDPRPVHLPFAFDHLPTASGELGMSLAQLLLLTMDCAKEATLSPAGRDFSENLRTMTAGREAPAALRNLAETLAVSKRPAIICGTGLGPANLPPLAADGTRLIREICGAGRLFYSLAGPNAFAASLLTSPRPFSTTLEAMEAGEIRALVTVENDPLLYFADRPRLEQALDGLELLLVMDYLPSATVARANILLPTTTVFESGGSFINQSGRIQYAKPVHRGGLPIALTGQGSHPPRIFSNEIPGGIPLNADLALRHLADWPNLAPPDAAQAPWHRLADDLPLARRLRTFSYPADGETVLPEESGQPFSATLVGLDKENEDHDGELTVLLVEATFGSEELSSYAELTGQLADPLCLYLHPADAGGRLEDGDRVSVPAGEERPMFTVRLTNKMAPGHLIIPRHPRLAGLHAVWPEKIGFDQLIEADSDKEE
ncbi:MAG: NADH-quinone oxidoreductase subunit NuoG [Deltaproteobacteria bacterium]